MFNIILILILIFIIFFLIKKNKYTRFKNYKEINNLNSNKIGPIAKLDKIQFANGLPKTRSGKIMRRILRKIASKQYDDLGDISTLLNPEIVQEIKDNSI